jgi:hypothetical protein
MYMAINMLKKSTHSSRKDRNNTCDKLTAENNAFL